MTASFRQFILATLNELFPNPKPSLVGWETPYQLLIAILLSGNSTDKAVNRVLPKLFSSAHDAQAMVQLDENTLAHIIAPCGLGAKKAKYILSLSAILIRNFQGEPPASMNALMGLSGVGRKTASVFLSIIYQQPTFPVDTHILRLARRWQITVKKTPSAAEKDLVRFFGECNTPKLHLQLIYYARKYCPAVGHRLDSCKICSFLKDTQSC